MAHSYRATAKILVLILYEWYLSQRDIEDTFSQVISIGRFRGLESPIVIVYAQGKLDQSSLACAYTRATAQCIVIYNSTSFFVEEELNILQQIVIRDVNEVRTEVEARWPLTKAMDLTPISLKSSKIFWSHTWTAWVFWEYKAEDPVGTSLWRYHLTESYNFASYILNTRNEPWSISVTGERHNEVAESYLLSWCDECHSWTRWGSDANGERCCLDCDMFDYRAEIPLEVEQLMKSDSILTNPNASSDEKMSLSPFLKALGYWRRIDKTKQEIIFPQLKGEMTGYLYQPYRYLFRLLTGIDMLLSDFDVVIKRDTLMNKYKKWFPELPLTDVLPFRLE